MGMGDLLLTRSNEPATAGNLRTIGRDVERDGWSITLAEFEHLAKRSRLATGILTAAETQAECGL